MNCKNIGIKLLDNIKGFLGMNKNEILKSIKANIKDDMKSLNFKIKGNRFERITNDEIIQELEFQGNSQGDEFTININIVPVNKDIPFINRSLRISQYVSNAPQWWKYTDESVKEVENTIKNQIIPIFIKLSTLEGLFDFITQPDILNDYEELMKLRQNINKNPELYLNQFKSIEMKPGLCLLDRYGSTEAIHICEKLNRFDIIKQIQKAIQI